MTVLTKLKQAAKRATGRSLPRLLSVKDAFHLSPNMIRVVFAGPELDGFPVGREGGNCKLLIPEAGESKEAFAQRLIEGGQMLKRTYTVRAYDETVQELTIDFVDHGGTGPAGAWAAQAKPGSFLGFAGPSQPKVTHFEADWYLVAADLSALPVAAAALEAMPREAKGVAIFEVPSKEDQIQIDMPPGIETHWLIHSDPHQESTAQIDFVRALEWPDGRVQTCIAGEQSVIRAMRQYVLVDRKTPRSDAYIAGYWKIGLVEEEHQALKRAES
ncbi:MAG: siderophore-interacting protein [Pseudomonadota bacterium]